jgi:cobaltochelatase CobS
MLFGESITRNERGKHTMGFTTQRAGLTLSLWDGRDRGKNLRIYVRGLARQHANDAVWLEEGAGKGAGNIYPPVARTYGDSNFVFALEKWLAAQGSPTWGQVCQWVMQPAAPAPAPIPENLRATLEEALIVHLAPAARMAGLAFKNGLQKAEIIERLLRNEELARRAVDALDTLRKGEKPENRAPSTPASDWLSDDAPAPPAPKSEASAPNVNLSEYVKRPELAPYAKHSDVNSVRSQVITAKEAIEGLQAQVKALQEAQPVVISLPNKPEPVKVNGLRHAKFEQMLRALQAGVHVMLVGPAGSGKTYAAEQAAHALSLTYHKQPPVNYAHEILGYQDAHSRYVRTATREAVEHGGLLNLDEFDASSADAGLACNQVADSSSFVSFPDGLIAKHKDFVIVAGTNTDGSGATMEYAGRARLDGATLNRFALIQWDYDSRLEDQVGAACPQWVAAVRGIRAFAKARGILDVVATMRDIGTGARLVAGGISRSDALEMTQKRGALKECWNDVLRLPAVATFLKG